MNPPVNWKVVGFAALFVIAAGLMLALFLGCSRGPNTAAGVKARQDAINDCILAGGHARLGTGSTILCD